MPLTTHPLGVVGHGLGRGPRNAPLLVGVGRSEGHRQRVGGHRHHQLEHPPLTVFLGDREGGMVKWGLSPTVEHPPLTVFLGG